MPKKKSKAKETEATLEQPPQPPAQEPVAMPDATAETSTRAEATIETETAAAREAEIVAEPEMKPESSPDDEETPETPALPPAHLERLQKILAQAGIASRRRAEMLITEGRVQVNGQIVTTLGTKADAGRDHIRVDGKLLQGAERLRYFVLNKPKGYVTTVSDPEGRPTVMQFFERMRERLYPVGRLDYGSEGLLLVTNDGELANKLTRAAAGVEKTYLVKVAGQPTEAELETLRGGVAIEKAERGSARVQTAPAQIRQVRVGDNPWFEVVLTEGRNRELRKMFEQIGHFVEKIRRVGYGPLVLDLEPGNFRELEPKELAALERAAEGQPTGAKRKRDKRFDPGALPTVTPRAQAVGGTKRIEKPFERRAEKPFEQRAEKPFERRGERGRDRFGKGPGQAPPQRQQRPERSEPAARPPRPFSKPREVGEERDRRPLKIERIGGEQAATGRQGQERIGRERSGPGRFERDRGGAGRGYRSGSQRFGQSRPGAERSSPRGERPAWNREERPAHEGRFGRGPREFSGKAPAEERVQRPSRGGDFTGGRRPGGFQATRPVGERSYSAKPSWKKKPETGERPPRRDFEKRGPEKRAFGGPRAAGAATKSARPGRAKPGGFKAGGAKPGGFKPGGPKAGGFKSKPGSFRGKPAGAGRGVQRPGGRPGGKPAGGRPGGRKRT